MTQFGGGIERKRWRWHGQRHPELSLAFAYQIHNAVAHGYFKVDYEIVWQTIHVILRDCTDRCSVIANME